MELKAAYDAVVSAMAEAQAIAQEIEGLFEASKTDEALALREKWDAAKAKADEIKSLYDDMAGTVNSDVARKFVPAARPKKEEAEKEKVMTRAEFDALTPAEQERFVLVDMGKIVDELEEVRNV